MNSLKPRIAIVGGGAFGACSAYELAKAGLDVTVFERHDTGSHASGRNPGNLNPILAAPPALRPLALASFRLHDELRAELLALGVRPYAVEPVRRVMICRDDAEADMLKTLAADFDAHAGFAARWLDQGDLHRIEARLAPDIERGLLLEGNRSLDALAFTRAVLEGAQHVGAQLRREGVLTISPSPTSGFRIETADGQFDADVVVLATGPWVADTADWLGLELPVRPVKGEMLSVRMDGPPLTHDFTSGMISLYRRGAGEIWIGVTREDAGFDEKPTAEARDHLLTEASRMLPAIGTAKVIEHLASLRPMAPGGLPLIGAVPGLPGAYVANGGGIKGMLTCVGAGRAIRDLIVSGHTELPVSPFSPRNTP